MNFMAPPLSGSDPPPAGGRLSDPNIHRGLAMPDEVLRNPRHERFAQELATGMTADSAYTVAGYRENRSNAARLNANRDIQKRVAEIQSLRPHARARTRKFSRRRRTIETPPMLRLAANSIRFAR